MIESGKEAAGRRQNAMRRRGCGRVMLLLLAVAVVLAPPAGAHEGHDHGAPAIATLTVVAPRVEATSDVFELVGIARGEALVIFLDRFSDNAPVTRAAIDVTENGETVRAEPQPDGTFLIKAPWLSRTGPRDLIFAIDSGEATDLLIGTLVLPAEAAGTEDRESALAVAARSPLLWAVGVALLGLGLILGRSLAPRGGERIARSAVEDPATPPTPAGQRDGEAQHRAGAVLALALLVVAAPVPLPAAAVDSPRRLNDGSLFVPKPTQRLLTVRTTQIRAQQAAVATSLTGRVIADPTAGGLVQAGQAGRIEPPEEGLPVIGQRVLRGQVLATVVPVITSLERGGVQEQLAQIDSGIAIAEQRMARLSQLQGSVAQREIDEARRELQGLRQRRRALAPALADREVIRASASGVISVANVVAGQLVGGGAVLFEIVDPAKLWVEAVAYDPRAVADIGPASAMTADGETTPLDLIGRSLTLRQQAVPVQFRITRPSSTLKVGTPVIVYLQQTRTESGFILPRASVVRAANGEDIVFDHVSAERFIVRPVRVRPLDGERVVIDGIPEGARIVTEGADLLNQIR